MALVEAAVRANPRTGGRAAGRTPLSGRESTPYVTGSPQPDATILMPRPIVAVSATTRQESDSDPARVRLNAAYIDAIRRAGGVPLVAAPLDAGDAGDVIAAADALVLTGGEDVDPALYGAPASLQLGRVTAARDQWEIALVHAARHQRVPTLGVCRGIQVLNVALGGTLIQDIGTERPGALSHEQSTGRTRRSHRVAFAAGSRTASIMGAACEVNSMHHQAILDAAPGLAVTGHAPDGIIESVEWSGPEWWALGVQWHPEELDGTDAELFAAVVAAGGARVR